MDYGSWKSDSGNAWPAKDEFEVGCTLEHAGYYVTFQTDASNLGTNALGRTGDGNSRPDVYLYTNVRKLTLVQSVEQKAVPLPGGGQNPSASFYANYLVFDSPAPLGETQGAHQVYMRYLGGL